MTTVYVLTEYDTDFMEVFSSMELLKEFTALFPDREFNDPVMKEIDNYHNQINSGKKFYRAELKDNGKSFGIYPAQYSGTERNGAIFQDSKIHPPPVEKIIVYTWAETEFGAYLILLGKCVALIAEYNLGWNIQNVLLDLTKKRTS